MKKYKLIILIFTLAAFLIGGIGYGMIHSYKESADNRYRVEINRISTLLVEEQKEFNEYIAGTTGITEIDHKLYQDSEAIRSISYFPILILSRENLTVQESVAAHGNLTAQGSVSEQVSLKEEQEKDLRKFYGSTDNLPYEIVPLLKDGVLYGYLKFEYVRESNYSNLIFVFEAGVVIIYILSVGILCYIYFNIVAPFHKLSNMPLELSKGDFNQDMKESRNRYFGRFLWGIGMLKDSLDIHKKKELTLLKEKKLLLLSLSHDIKTPLNAISLYAKALKEGLYETGEETKEAATKILERTSEIDSYVKQIIQSSTEDILTIEVHNSEFYLNELMEKVISGYQPKLLLRNVIFQVDKFENPILKGDVERIYEVVGNIIENALKYGDGKKIAISFSQEEYCQLIHIFNTGTPIEEKDMLHLFESFYRGSNVEGKEGNGLGLYICKEIMKKTMGDIYCIRHEDGMEFVLVCPLC